MNLEEKEMMEEKYEEEEEEEGDGSHLEAAAQMNKATGRLTFSLG